MDVKEHIQNGCQFLDASHEPRRFSRRLPKFFSGTPSMDVFEATRLMFKLRVKKLPITENNRLVGIVTLTDIARATSIDQRTIELIEQLSNMHIIA